MLVFMGDVLTVDFHMTRVFPILEIVPPVGKTTWSRGFPIGIEDTRELETDAGFRVGEVGMEV